MASSPCALALAVLVVDQQLARYLLAAGFFGHALWDVAHHVVNRVVPRGYAEFCGVLDVFVGATLFVR